MQTFLRGTEPHCRLKLSHWLTLNLSEPSQKKQFSGQELVLLILTGGLNVAGDPLQSFIAANTWESARCPHTWNVYREQKSKNQRPSLLSGSSRLMPRFNSQVWVQGLVHIYNLQTLGAFKLDTIRLTVFEPFNLNLLFISIRRAPGVCTVICQAN